MGLNANKQLILHIGASRTGSTAIQEFLRLNAEPLSRLGVAVAPANLKAGGAVTGQHVALVQSHLENPAAARKKIANRIGKLIESTPPGSRLVLSAENLSSPAGVEQIFAAAAREYDTQVILYIRRQDEILLSAWRQWESKGTKDFWAWLISEVGRRDDWRVLLENWETVVPRENIAVRRYERDRLREGDVVADFAAALGIENSLSELQRPPAPVNASYSEALVEYAKGNPLLFAGKHDNSFSNSVEQLTGDKYRHNARESLLTHAQRCAILDRYRESNEWVRQRYFPDSPSPLFAPPHAEDYVYLGQDELTAQKWELTASLIFALAKRVLR